LVQLDFRDSSTLAKVLRRKNGLGSIRGLVTHHWVICETTWEVRGHARFNREVVPRWRSSGGQQFMSELAQHRCLVTRERAGDQQDSLTGLTCSEKTFGGDGIEIETIALIRRWVVGNHCACCHLSFWTGSRSSTDRGSRPATRFFRQAPRGPPTCRILFSRAERDTLANRNSSTRKIRRTIAIHAYTRFTTLPVQCHFVLTLRTARGERAESLSVGWIPT
jgi:hypothetical protein